MDEEKLKKLLGEQQEIVKGVREHFEKVEAGIFTKSEALEYEEKANKRFEEISKEIKAITDDLTARVGEIETKMKRLPQGGDKKDEVDIEKKAFNKWARFGSRVLEEDEQKALRPGSGGSFLSPAVMKAFDIDEKKVRWFLEVAREARKFPLSEKAPVKEVLTHLNLLHERLELKI